MEGGKQMIIINCSGETSLGGRTSDTFVLEEFDSLDELHDYIKTNQPVKAKEPTEYCRRTVIKMESLRDRLVYLNNYLHIRRVSYYIMDEEELEYLDDNVCKTCKYNDGTLDSAFSCQYSLSDKGCDTYVEAFSLKKWLKDKLLGGGVNDK